MGPAGVPAGTGRATGSDVAGGESASTEEGGGCGARSATSPTTSSDGAGGAAAATADRATTGSGMATGSADSSGAEGDDVVGEASSTAGPRGSSTGAGADRVGRRVAGIDSPVALGASPAVRAAAGAAERCTGSARENASLGAGDDGTAWVETSGADVGRLGRDPRVSAFPLAGAGASDVAERATTRASGTDGAASGGASGSTAPGSTGCSPAGAAGSATHSGPASLRPVVVGASAGGVDDSGWRVAMRRCTAGAGRGSRSVRDPELVDSLVRERAGDRWTPARRPPRRVRRDRPDVPTGRGSWGSGGWSARSGTRPAARRCRVSHAALQSRESGPRRRETRSERRRADRAPTTRPDRDRRGCRQRRGSPRTRRSRDPAPKALAPKATAWSRLLRTDRRPLLSRLRCGS